MKSEIATSTLSHLSFALHGEDAGFNGEPANLPEIVRAENEEIEFTPHPSLRAFAQTHATTLAVHENQSMDIAEIVDEIDDSPRNDFALPKAVAPKMTAQSKRKTRVKVPEHAVAPLPRNCSPTAYIAEQNASRLREVTLHARHTSRDRKSVV